MISCESSTLHIVGIKVIIDDARLVSLHVNQGNLTGRSISGV